MDMEGRVLLYHQGTWGTVCADRWDDADAQVVCRHWGYSGGHARWLSRDWNRTRVLYDVQCWGWEGQLAQCAANNWDTQGMCYYSGDAGVTCTPHLYEGEARVESDGRVAVVVNGSWRSICAHGWDDRDASVACVQLGYAGGNATRLPFHANYSKGLYQVSCQGYESRLLDCMRDSYDMYAMCGWGSDDAGVLCHGHATTTPYPYASTSSYIGLTMDPEGRVLAYRQGMWGTVCADQWDDADAQVVCRQWGYSGGRALWFPRDWNHTRVLYDVHCWGGEGQLAQCPTSFWDASGTCYFSGDAGVSCYHQPAVREMRLETDGRLIVEVNGTWRSVCANGFGQAEAQVACRSLGYSSGQPLYLSRDWNYTQGLFNASCTGQEAHYRDCQADYSDVHGSCNFSGDAGAVCSYQPQEGQARVEPDGRVAVVVNGSWRSICAHGWDDRDASVVCVQLGYAGGNATRLPFHANYSKGLYQVSCQGYESRLLDCMRDSYDMYAMCGWVSDDAGVLCHGHATTTPYPYAATPSFIALPGSLTNYSGETSTPFGHLTPAPFGQSSDIYVGASKVFVQLPHTSEQPTPEFMETSSPLAQMPHSTRQIWEHVAHSSETYEHSTQSPTPLAVETSMSWAHASAAPGHTAIPLALTVNTFGQSTSEFLQTPASLAQTGHDFIAHTTVSAVYRSSTSSQPESPLVQTVGVSTQPSNEFLQASLPLSPLSDASVQTSMSVAYTTDTSRQTSPLGHTVGNSDQSGTGFVQTSVSSFPSLDSTMRASVAVVYASGNSGQATNLLDQTTGVSGQSTTGYLLMSMPLAHSSIVSQQSPVFDTSLVHSSYTSEQSSVLAGYTSDTSRQTTASFVQTSDATRQSTSEFLQASTLLSQTPDILLQTSVFIAYTSDTSRQTTNPPGQTTEISAQASSGSLQVSTATTEQSTYFVRTSMSAALASENSGQTTSPLRPTTDSTSQATSWFVHTSTSSAGLPGQTTTNSVQTSGPPGQTPSTTSVTQTYVSGSQIWASPGQSSTASTLASPYAGLSSATDSRRSAMDSLQTSASFGQPSSSSHQGTTSSAVSVSIGIQPTTAAIQSSSTSTATTGSPSSAQSSTQQSATTQKTTLAPATETPTKGCVAGVGGCYLAFQDSGALTSVQPLGALAVLCLALLPLLAQWAA